MPSLSDGVIYIYMCVCLSLSLSLSLSIFLSFSSIYPSISPSSLSSPAAPQPTPHPTALTLTLTLAGVSQVKEIDKEMDHILARRQVRYGPGPPASSSRVPAPFSSQSQSQSHAPPPPPGLGAALGQAMTDAPGAEFALLHALDAEIFGLAHEMKHQSGAMERMLITDQLRRDQATLRAEIEAAAAEGRFFVPPTLTTTTYSSPHSTDHDSREDMMPEMMPDQRFGDDGRGRRGAGEEGEDEENPDVDQAAAGLRMAHARRAARRFMAMDRKVLYICIYIVPIRTLYIYMYMYMYIDRGL